ncbi:MAG TPA: hybrid sensor histidine kinase/response regulator, partial [Phenylobacterium sp.]
MSDSNRGRAMAEIKSKGRTRRIDPMTVMAVLCFLAAVAFAAVPAFHAGPATRAGIMLLIGLFGVACLGLFALRGSTQPVAVGESGADKMIDALAEPAAIAAADGRIHAAN